jgi:general stress protein CsbA
MPDRRLLIAIAAVIALPILFAAIGGGRFVGIAIGVVLVAVGIGSMLVRRDEGAGDGDG